MINPGIATLKSNTVYGPFVSHFIYLIHRKAVVLSYLTAFFSLVVMKLTAVCILQLLVDAGIRQNCDSTVNILSRPQVWQLRHHSLIPGRGRDFSLLQSAHATSGSHPAPCSVGMWVAWLEADHSCPFSVVLRLSVCVELKLHSPKCLYGMHRNNFTDTRLHWKHWIIFLS